MSNDQTATTDAERILRDGQKVLDDSKRLADDLRQAAEKANPTQALQATYEQNPYAVIAGAAGVGYLLGGGLFTPFTRRMLRIGMKALIVPLALSQARQLSADPIDPTDPPDNL